MEGEGEEEEEEEKFHHTGVFRGSWRKKMGKVFICGLPLRSGPMAALNRSQLRGVGSYLSSREESAGSRPQAEEQPVDPRRGAVSEDVELFRIYPNDFSETTLQTHLVCINEFSSQLLQLFAESVLESLSFSLSLNLIQVCLLKLVLFVILIS